MDLLRHEAHQVVIEGQPPAAELWCQDCDELLARERPLVQHVRHRLEVGHPCAPFGRGGLYIEEQRIVVWCATCEQLVAEQQLKQPCDGIRLWWRSPRHWGVSADERRAVLSYGNRQQPRDFR